MQLFFIVNLLSAIYLSGKSGKFPIKDLGIINAALRLIKAVHGAVGSVGDIALGGVGGAYFGAKASVNFASDLRSDVYKKVQKFSFANIDKFSTGSLVTRLTNDITQMQNFINMLLRMCLRAPGMLIGALIMAIVLNPKLTLVLCVSIPLLLLSISVFVKKGFARFGIMQEKVDSLNSTVQENITNERKGCQELCA